jgi:hypothetical protein
MINKDESDAPDPPMVEPNSKSEENMDTSSKKQDVDPHDPMKEEDIIPLDLDQEAFKNPDVAPQDLLEQDHSTPLDLARKMSWADQAEEGETLEQHEPPDQGMLGMEGEALKSSKRKEAWTTVVKKKKSSSGAQSMVTRSRTHNPI